LSRPPEPKASPEPTMVSFISLFLGRHSGARARASEPGIQMQTLHWCLDSGFARLRLPASAGAPE
jgi:hypothetical protein